MVISNFLLVQILSILKTKRTAIVCHKHFGVKNIDQLSLTSVPRKYIFFPEHLVKGSAKNRISMQIKKKNSRKIANIPRN